MRKALLAVVTAVAVSVGFVGLTSLGATATNTDPNADHKVTVCHRTGSATNPYVSVTVDIASSGYVKGGHTGHDQVGNGLGGDIIPAYDAFAKNGKDYEPFSFPGKNLGTSIGGSTGAEILANGCRVPNTEVPEEPVFEPVASLTDPGCENLNVTATLDNTQSEDGDGEGGDASVTFVVKVNGNTVASESIAAGDAATLEVGPLADGDTVTVSVGGDVLASITADLDNCDRGNPNPPEEPEAPSASAPNPVALPETL